MSDWSHVCVVCSTRNRQTRLQHGHCCAACADRLLADIRAIADLATMAAASLTPRAGSGAMSTAYGSKPPVNVDALDPELATIELTPGDPTSAVTILECAESWERMIREERGMAPYGPISHARASKSPGGGNDTRVTLIGCTSFLAAQVEYAITEPEFSLEEFASEMSRCVRVLKRWDTEAEDLGTMVKCPTLNDDGSECSYRLYYRSMDEHVTCRRCGVTRDAATLVVVAMSDGRDVWLDPEAAAKWLGISESTLKRMARRGDVERSHGRYRIRTVSAVG